MSFHEIPTCGVIRVCSDVAAFCSATQQNPLMREISLRKMDDY